MFSPHRQSDKLTSVTFLAGFRVAAPATRDSLRRGSPKINQLRLFLITDLNAKKFNRLLKNGVMQIGKRALKVAQQSKLRFIKLSAPTSCVDGISLAMRFKFCVPTSEVQIVA
jgi:hypothetical protein